MVLVKTITVVIINALFRMKTVKPDDERQAVLLMMKVVIIIFWCLCLLFVTFWHPATTFIHLLRHVCFEVNAKHSSFDVVFLTARLSPVPWQWQPCHFHGNTSSLPAEDHSCFIVQTGW